MAYCLQSQRIPSQSFQQQSKKCEYSEYRLLQSLNVPPSTNLKIKQASISSQDFLKIFFRLCQKFAQGHPGPGFRCPARPSRTAFLPIDGAGDIEATANTNLQLAEAPERSSQTGAPSWVPFGGWLKTGKTLSKWRPTKNLTFQAGKAWIFLDPQKWSSAKYFWSLYLVTPKKPWKISEKRPSFY